jgi:hypothetical protein
MNAWKIALLLSGIILRAAGAEVRNTNYHGWSESLVVSNGKVEAIIVPAIGRVMQFRFAGDTDGPFWENRRLDGKAPDPKSAEWGNFGGDKTWPSPQAEWGKVTGRGWPPPGAFDSMAVKAELKESTIILTSSIDPNFGIRTERKIRLEPGKPVMTIETIYEKVSGAPIKAGVWIITQLKDPELVTMPLATNTQFPDGYNKQSEVLPENLKRTVDSITCTRSKTKSTKIGSDAETLIWQDKRWKLTIESPRQAAKEYPDNGSSAEIYTNPDPLDYVELEMLGPVELLKAGDRLSQTNRYTLERSSAK